MALLKSTVTVVALAFAMSATAAARSSSCPFNYPANLNTTESDNGLVFTIASTNAATNNRVVQLRPDPLIPTGSIAVIDPSSPVLLGNLRLGGFWSQARNNINQLYDLGPTGHLNSYDETSAANGTTTRFSFAFSGPDEWPGGVDTDWALTAGSSTGTYSPFHAVDIGIVNGFLLCEQSGNDTDTGEGSWYRLFYLQYTGSPADIPGCESVGVRTSVAPSIFNGACDIGGYVAEQRWIFEKGQDYMQCIRVIS
ncbi:hypothetical protein SLS62_005150 [Diatrype stigma]|uniref:Uncharacterized protein n=1 Tax=Diatrype stigma TaxID=117547 RepID=A0AAN9YNN6_9PEZI